MNRIADQFLMLIEYYHRTSVARNNTDASNKSNTRALLVNCSNSLTDDEWVITFRKDYKLYHTSCNYLSKEIYLSLPLHGTLKTIKRSQGKSIENDPVPSLEK